MRKSAFTLIELLVVIAIIAILAAILFPVFAQAKEAAKKTAGLSQLKQVGTATAIYTSDYDDTFGLNGVKAIPCYGSDGSYAYSYGAMVPFPSSAWTWSNSANDQCKANAANSFMTNAMQPYFKNNDLLKDAGTSFDRAPVSFLLDPDANRGAGGVNLPKNLSRFSYTYNGLLSGYNASSVVSSATTPVYWHGQGKRNIYGHVYGSPALICDYDQPNCTYVPTKANCDPGKNGETSFHTTNTNKSGWNVFSGGVIYSYADSHAKFRKLGVGGNVKETDAVATTNPIQDPFSAYLGNVASGRWYSSSVDGGAPCHSYLFRPDWDGTTRDGASYSVGSADQP